MSGPKRRAATRKRPISITSVVDCVGSLANRSLHGNVYLFDTNKAGGSTGIGTEELKTRVRKGDELLWTVFALECGAYVSIDDVVIDKEVCAPERKVYPGTDVSYWIGAVKKDDIGVLPYQIKYKIGTRAEPMTAPLSPRLVGEAAGRAR